MRELGRGKCLNVFIIYSLLLTVHEHLSFLLTAQHLCNFIVFREEFVKAVMEEQKVSKMLTLNILELFDF